MPFRSKEEPSQIPSSSVAGIVSFTVLAALFLAAVFYSMPSNVLDLRDRSPQRSMFTQVFPEAWGFFTKPPNSPEVGAFRVSGNSIESALSFPHSRSENAYGLSRKHRAQGPEIAEISTAVEDSKWIDCNSIEGDCVFYAGSRTEPLLVENKFPSRSLCGNLVLAETIPVAWSYKDSYEGWRTERRAVNLEVQCE